MNTCSQKAQFIVNILQKKNTGQPIYPNGQGKGKVDSQFYGDQKICRTLCHLPIWDKPTATSSHLTNFTVSSITLVSYFVISSTLLLLLLSFKSLQLPLLEPFFLKGLREGKCKNINQVINLQGWVQVTSNVTLSDVTLINIFYLDANIDKSTVRLHYLRIFFMLTKFQGNQRLIVMSSINC